MLHNHIFFQGGEIDNYNHKDIQQRYYPFRMRFYFLIRTNNKNYYFFSVPWHLSNEEIKMAYIKRKTSFSNI